MKHNLTNFLRENIYCLKINIIRNYKKLQEMSNNEQFNVSLLKQIEVLSLDKTKWSFQITPKNICLEQLNHQERKALNPSADIVQCEYPISIRKDGKMVSVIFMKKDIEGKYTIISMYVPFEGLHKENYLTRVNSIEHLHRLLTSLEQGNC